MLFFAGIFFIVTGLVLTIKLIIKSSRPKADALVNDVVFKKMKSDMFQMGPDHPHAQVSYTVEGNTYEAEVQLLKKPVHQKGETIKVSYSKSDPKTPRYHNPGKEFLLSIIAYVAGGVLIGISVLVTNLIS